MHESASVAYLPEADRTMTKQMFKLRIESNRRIDPEELECVLEASNETYRHDIYLEITKIRVDEKLK
mgnify:CR=1 FL=1